ncbi:MAG: hypothetical protein JRI70_09725 [Deltaproteobacteria bacterium]|nr:hypothetical protein [Deltaproteobacteria bacterium]
MAETTHEEPVTVDAEDLQFYIDNDRDLYREIWTPTTAELTRRKSTGTYDPDVAITAFRFLTGDGARKYIKEFPGSIITDEVRHETAVSMRDRFEIEHSLGNYEYLEEHLTPVQTQFIEECYQIGMRNGWCSGKFAQMDGDYIVEEDRLNKNSFKIYADLEELKDVLSRSNWCLGTSCVYHDLCFMNQVDGGGEWLTIKRFDDEVIAFESMSMSIIVEAGEFEDTIQRLEAATKEQCRTYTY